MRKLLLTTAAVAAAIAGAVAGETDFGTFTDTRDGQTYKTVTIGTQTWMAENINYKTDSSWCYDNNADNCKRYGRLYDWKAAATICPKGWKLSSREDWTSLIATAGGWKTAGEKLKSKSGWNDNYDESSGNGTDYYGFSALPGGYHDSDGYFGLAGINGRWWTATEYNSDNAYLRNILYHRGNVDEGYDHKSNGHSVRCVADRP